MGGRGNLEGIFFMAKKGQTFQQYTEDFKLTAIKAYLEGSTSYKVVSEKWGSEIAHH
jgi:transposase